MRNGPVHSDSDNRMPGSAGLEWFQGDRRLRPCMNSQAPLSLGFDLGDPDKNMNFTDLGALSTSRMPVQLLPNVEEPRR